LILTIWGKGYMFRGLPDSSQKLSTRPQRVQQGVSLEFDPSAL
jgi:hypothetical protein